MTTPVPAPCADANHLAAPGGRWGSGGGGNARPTAVAIRRGQDAGPGWYNGKPGARAGHQFANHLGPPAQTVDHPGCHGSRGGSGKICPP